MTGSSAREILRRQGMPPEEVRAVFGGADALIARRLLELHRERLEEWLHEQRRLVMRIEQAVAGVPDRGNEASSKDRRDPSSPFGPATPPGPAIVRTAAPEPASR